jgi:hypothetical protein
MPKMEMCMVQPILSNGKLPEELGHHNLKFDPVIMAPFGS